MRKSFAAERKQQRHLWLRGLQNLGMPQPSVPSADRNRTSRPFDQVCSDGTTSFLLPAIVARLLESSAVGAAVWGARLETSGLHSTRAAWEQIRSGCLEGKVLPRLWRAKDTLVQRQGNWRSMREGDGYGWERGRGCEGDTGGGLVKQTTQRESLGGR